MEKSNATWALRRAPLLILAATLVAPGQAATKSQPGSAPLPLPPPPAQEIDRRTFLMPPGGAPTIVERVIDNTSPIDGISTLRPPRPFKKKVVPTAELAEPNAEIAELYGSLRAALEKFGLLPGQLRPLLCPEGFRQEPPGGYPFPREPIWNYFLELSCHATRPDSFAEFFLVSFSAGLLVQNLELRLPEPIECTSSGLARRFGRDATAIDDTSKFNGMINVGYTRQSDRNWMQIMCPTEDEPFFGRIHKNKLYLLIEPKPFPVEPP